MLRCNTACGFATIIAEEVSSGGKPIVRVLLDRNGEERVFLRGYVTESDTPVPSTAKKRPRKPRAKKVVPEVSDDLIYEQTPAQILPSLDPLPTDEADYDDVGLLPDTGEVAGERTDTV